MAIATTESKIMYYGDAHNTVWPFPYPVMQGEDIKVIITAPGAEDQTLPQNLYDVGGISEGAANVIYPLEGEPLPCGHKITLLRKLALVSDFDPDNGASFYAEDITTEFDRQLMMIQQLAEQVGRTPQIPISEEKTFAQMFEGVMSASQEAQAAAEAAVGTAQAAAGQAQSAATVAQGAAELAEKAVKLLEPATPSSPGLVPALTGPEGSVPTIEDGALAWLLPHEGAVYNKAVLTTAGTWAAPVDGVYLFTVVGGGGAGGNATSGGTASSTRGGGAGGSSSVSIPSLSLTFLALGGGGGGGAYSCAGAGGGACGKVTRQSVWLPKGAEIEVVVGAGGLAGGSADGNGVGGDGNTPGNDGGLISGYVAGGQGARGAGTGGTAYWATWPSAGNGGSGGQGSFNGTGYGGGGGGAAAPNVSSGWISGQVGQGIDGGVNGTVGVGGMGGAGAIIIEWES